MKQAIGLVVFLSFCSLPTAAQGLVPLPERGMVIDSYGMLFVFDTDPASIVAAIRLDQPGGGATDCLISADGRRGYVTDLQHRVWVIDLTSSPPQLAAGVNPISISGFGTDVAATPDGQFLVVANGGLTPPSISVVDLAARTSSSFNPGVPAHAVDVCSDGSVLIASALTGGGIRRFKIDAAGHLTDAGDGLFVANPYNVYCAPGAASGIAMTFDGQIQTFRIPGLTPVSHRTLPAYGAAGAISKDGLKFYGRSFFGVTAFDFDQATGELGPAAIFSTTAGSAGLFNTAGSEQVALDLPDAKVYVPERHQLGVVDAGTGFALAPLLMPDLLGSGGICFGPRAASGCVVAECDDGNPCTDDRCGDAGCVHVPDDTNVCGDPLSCGNAHACSAGTCVPAGPADCNATCPPGFTEYFDVCQKIYDIGASLLDGLNESCDGTGVNRFNCDGTPYGFHWTDVSGDGVGRVQGVDLTFITGLNCAPGFSDATLNGALVDRFDRDLDCTCSPAHTPERLYPLPDYYVKDGVNVISIVPSGLCEGLSASPIIDGFYAQVTVSYSKRDPNCATATCNPATDRCEYSVIRCDDENPCTIDTCDAEGACVYEPAPEYTSCDDGNYCSGYEYCDGFGNCISNGPLYCGGDGNPCTIDSCDPILGCMYEPGPAGAPCDDFSSCTTDDACDANGYCVGRSLCDDGLPCTDDIADPGNACACTHVMSFPGTQCDDGIPCTVNTTCDGTGSGASACTGGQSTCDDGNPCTDDACDAVLGCVHTNNSSACDDFNACTGVDRCAGGSCQHIPVTCDDGNPCTDDACHLVAGCVHTARPDGTTCDDGNAGTGNDACQGGVCAGDATCTTTNDPKTWGWYHSLCTSGGHSGDAITDADAACVAGSTAAFAGIATAAEVCDILSPSHHGNDPAGKAEKQLMTLALNLCRHRVCPAQGLDATCSSAATVALALAAVDAVLADPGHTNQQLAAAECQATEINNGHALRLDTLAVTLEGSAVRLTWVAPTLDDGTGTPTGYDVWRRVLGSRAPFTRMATTTNPSYLDSAAASGAFEYEVTSVMN
jgi:hypothetical protein